MKAIGIRNLVQNKITDARNIDIFKIKKFNLLVLFFLLFLIKQRTAVMMIEIDKTAGE
jgi:hypothetical protein